MRVGLWCLGGISWGLGWVGELGTGIGSVWSVWLVGCGMSGGFPLDVQAATFSGLECRVELMRVNATSVVLRSSLLFFPPSLLL